MKYCVNKKLLVILVLSIALITAFPVTISGKETKKTQFSESQRRTYWLSIMDKIAFPLRSNYGFM
ncbi:hypothetical protein [uncultured Bacteroides sp.]|uniref:hypothetical protein n=1 Tax=uncultured Bacteroides sp. TaxID=162156 RepID=UPI002AAA97B8|nr:hypothetical protein [uncultured Bacteroides sp.]